MSEDDQKQTKEHLTNVERTVQQPEKIKESKKREVEQAKNPYPHTLRETQHGR